MRHIWIVAKLDLLESFRSRWFLVYNIVFGLLVALFFVSGVIDSKVMGFSGLSRLLLIFIQVCIVILPIFILVTTVRTIAGDRDSNVLEYMLSFPISLFSYYFGKFIGRFITVFTPIIAALLLAVVWGALKGASAPWGVLLYYIALMCALTVSFLGISFFISSLVKNQEMALGSAFFVWLLLLAFVDILLIGFIMKTGVNPAVIYSISLINPMQVFRVGAIALFDPELSVIGPAAYFILDSFGKLFFSLYAVLYPIVLGLAFAFGGFVVFKRSDLV
jgi:ABC-2 type transport system permease protein